jgi:ribosome recycling factor
MYQNIKTCIRKGNEYSADDVKEMEAKIEQLNDEAVNNSDILSHIKAEMLLIWLYSCF